MRPCRPCEGPGLLVPALIALLAGAAGAADEAVMLARTAVPNALLPQGEVRVLRRPDSVVVQSVIHTRFAGRVHRHIASNEQRNWGDDTNAVAYLTALDEAFETYAARRGEGDALVIEFVAKRDGAAGVALCFAPVKRTDAGLTLGTARPWRTLTLAPAYILKDQEFIVEDAFGSGAAAVLQTLRAGRGEAATHE